MTEIFLKKLPVAFVQIGSSGEYGALKSPQNESSKCNPKSIYGQAKLLATKYLIRLFKKKISMYNFKTVSGVWSETGF